MSEEDRMYGAICFILFMGIILIVIPFLVRSKQIVVIDERWWKFTRRYRYYNYDDERQTRCKNTSWGTTLPPLPPPMPCDRYNRDDIEDTVSGIVLYHKEEEDRPLQAIIPLSAWDDFQINSVIYIKKDGFGRVTSYKILTRPSKNYTLYLPLVQKR